MNQGNDRQAAVILSLIGIIPVVWLGLLIAPSVKGGLPEIIDESDERDERPVPLSSFARTV